MSLLKYDIEAWDFLDRERLRSNRNRIVEKNRQGSDKQGGQSSWGKGAEEIEGVDALEWTLSRTQPGWQGRQICYKFRDGKFVTKVKTAHSSTSRIPSHVQLLQRRRVGVKRVKRASPSESRKSKEEMAKIPYTYFQQGNCRRGISALTNMRTVQKLRPALLKGMLVLQRERDCQRLHRPWRNSVIEQLCSHQKWNTSRFLQLVNNKTLCIDHDCMRKAVQGQIWYLKLILWSSMVPRSLPASSRKSSSLTSIRNPHAVFCTDDEGSVTCFFL